MFYPISALRFKLDLFDWKWQRRRNPAIGGILRTLPLRIGQRQPEDEMMNGIKHFFLGRKIIALSMAAFGVLPVGCAVGPDYRPPAPPHVQTYTSADMPTDTFPAKTKEEKPQCLVPGRKLPEQWWGLFRSEPLDQMIRSALKNNQTIAAARATLRRVQEDLRAQYGTGRFPTVDADLSAGRKKFLGAAFGQSGSGGSIFNLYNASVQVSYLLDIFGGVTRELEALQSQVDYQGFLLEGARLTLSANVVSTLILEASLRARIQATRDIAADQEKQYDVVETQFQLGGVSRSDVLAQYTQLWQTRASLPPLEKQLYQTRHLLAVLLGRFPSEADALPELGFEGLELPCELPVSLPSDLTRQRPDVRAAEALLHAASAQVGVATANLYPKFTLSGSYGSETTSTSNLLRSETMIWNIGAGMLQPLFHGGALTAKRRAAVAAYDQAMANYRQTVLQAFKDVADVLRALDADARTLRAETEAAQAARKSLALTKEQFRLGAVSYLTLLNAQRQYQQTRINQIQARAARYSDTAALFQALGGGWWHPVAETESLEDVVDK